jgi:hypothetical protein
MAKGSADQTIVRMPAEGEGDAPAPTRKKPGPKPGKKRKRRTRKGGLTNSHAVAICVEQLGRKDAPLDGIQNMLKERFRIRLKPTTISQYKSTYLKRLRETGQRAVLPDDLAAPAPRVRKAAPSSGEVSLDEIRDIKALVSRMGPERFRALVELILS